MNKILFIIALLLPLSATAQDKGLVSLDKAIASMVADIASKFSVKTEIAIVEKDASFGEAAGFIIDDLTSQLVASGKFKVLARGKDIDGIIDEQKFQQSGLVDDKTAVSMGKFLGAKVVITGSFLRTTGFSQIRLRVVDVQSSEILAAPQARIRPNDEILATVLTPANKVKLPTITDKALDHLEKGQDLIRAGKYEEAIQELDKALAINKDLAEAYFHRAQAYFFGGGNNCAIADYNAALKIKPDYERALVERAWAHSNNGDYDDAIADFNAALKIKPDYERALIGRAGAYSNKGDFKQAAADYTAALKIKPDEVVTFTRRGDIYFDKGDFKKAIEDYTAALKIKPSNPNENRVIREMARIQNKRGIAYYNIGDYDKAIADWNAILNKSNYYEAERNLKRVPERKKLDALKIKSNDHEALMRRAQKYIFNEDYDKAIADYTAALKIKPDDAEALVWRGRAYGFYRKNDYDKAIADYTAALKIEPKNYRILRDRGDNYFRKGDYYRAIADYTASLKIEPNGKSVLFLLLNRGEAYLKRGDIDKAIADFEAVLQIEPDEDEPDEYEPENMRAKLLLKTALNRKKWGC